MVLGSGTIANYDQFIYNCTLNQFNYKVPVNSLQDVQLYAAFGTSAPGSPTIELIHTCGPDGGTIETLTTSEFVTGQDTNQNYYGVFRNFNETTTATCFVLAVTAGGQIYFSQEYCIVAPCESITFIQGCYGNLDPLISYDREGIYFGLSQGGTTGDATVFYKHYAYMRRVELTINAVKNTFKKGRTRNFRVESEDILQFWGEPIPEWYLKHIDAIFKRGEIFVGDTKYLVEETSYDKLDECFKNWKPSATLVESYYQSFSCEADPCAPPTESGGGSGGGPTVCCDPSVTNATVSVGDGGENDIAINFTPCTPSPANGYQVLWKVAGSSGGFTVITGVSGSPATFTDSGNPPGTNYEGFIASDCGDGILGNYIPWSTGAPNSYTLRLASPCSGILSSFIIEGGSPGDVVTVRASFGGAMQKIGGNFVRADLTVSSPDGVSDPIQSSPCYPDTGMHGFTITADSVITMPGATEVVTVNAVVNNSSSSIANLALTIIDINGNSQNISAVGCAGNSSTGGTC